MSVSSRTVGPGRAGGRGHRDPVVGAAGRGHGRLRDRPGRPRRPDAATPVAGRWIGPTQVPATTSPLDRRPRRRPAHDLADRGPRRHGGDHAAVSGPRRRAATGSTSSATSSGGRPAIPTHGVTVANELHIPVGEPVELQLTSADVIHSFWVPELHGKLDLLPDDHQHARARGRRARRLRRRVRRVLRAPARQHGLPRRRPTARPSSRRGWRPSSSRPPSRRRQPERGERSSSTRAARSCHVIRGAGSRRRAGPGPHPRRQPARRWPPTRSTNTPADLAGGCATPTRSRPGRPCRRPS